MANEQVLHLKSGEVTREALSGKGVALVDFWASWCGPCRMIAPTVEQLAAEYAGRVLVGKVNVDEEADAAVSYGVASIPTLIVFKDGIEQERIVGAQSKSILAKALDRALA